MDRCDIWGKDEGACPERCHRSKTHYGFSASAWKHDGAVSSTSGSVGIEGFQAVFLVIPHPEFFPAQCFFSQTYIKGQSFFQRDEVIDWKIAVYELQLQLSALRHRYDEVIIKPVFKIGKQ